MFEDFRKQTDESSLASHPQIEEVDPRDELMVEEPELHFLGMTAVQRFALMLLVFIMTAILGVLLLLVTDRLALPFAG